MIDDLIDAFAEAFRPLTEALARVVDNLADALRYTPPPPPRRKQPLIHNGRKPRK
ncbi:hypothetical protein PQE16_gp53 [Arthrobacter phage Reedo]|jgi:hypothetical protein|uniref:Uncharacterized protein n=1 Tax=Arthrobacter phage Reedo TaxID=2910755 RepID=A0AA49GYU2_9CAUD|nr:hypothetical protein PQE16_gp53 [Arthrobacter phage Reedo]UJQ86843.1 hypothetical protein SEA_REEDO_53 [Arthrobacter phage Reedo]